MTRIGLDMYDEVPRDMRTYLRNYGYHFNKKAFDFAVGMMRKKNGNGKEERIKPWTKEQVNEMLSRYNVTLDNDIMYDAAYVANMAQADFLNSSIADEKHLALYVKDVIDDVDAGEGDVFNAFYAKMVRAGIPIEWEDLL